MITSLIEKIKKYISPEIQEVYCQNCGNELTNSGADVSSDGKVYCHGYDIPNCAIMNTFRSGNMTFAEYYERSADVQKLIRKGKLTHHGKLEEKLI